TLQNWDVSSDGRVARPRRCAPCSRPRGPGRAPITNLKSSSDDRGGRPGGDVDVPVATGLRLRGARGCLTARLIPGGIDQLEGRDWVLVGRAGGVLRRFSIEEYSIYK